MNLLARLSLIVVLVIAISPARQAGAEPADAEEFDCLALTLYWETRGQSAQEMIAVASVVLNRKNNAKFPSSVCAVVRQGGEEPPCQFSYWCDGRGDKPEPGQAWTQAQRIAKLMLTAPPEDPTGGALYFHKTGMRIPWTIQRERTTVVGEHVFYR